MTNRVPESQPRVSGTNRGTSCVKLLEQSITTEKHEEHKRLQIVANNMHITPVKTETILPYWFLRNLVKLCLLPLSVTATLLLYVLC